MVVSLSFVHPKGSNIAGRFWPHHGHLGLTPLTVSGVIRVRAENESNFPISLPATTPSSSSVFPAASLNGNPSDVLKASQVSVSLRCYEARLGRVGVVKKNVLFDHTVRLWSASASKPVATGRDDTTVAELPHTDFPFNICIPPSSAAGCSSCHLQSYRVYWRLEANVNGFQVPGYGPRLAKHYDVAITRYNSPTTFTPLTYSHTPDSRSSPSTSATPQAHVVHTIPITAHPHVLALTTYRPQRTIGPSEEFPVTIALTVRGNHSMLGKDQYGHQQQQYPSPPSSSPSVSSSPTATFLGASDDYREGNVTPLKVVASVKRIVELLDEDSPTVDPATPSVLSKWSNVVPPSPPPYHSVACARESLSPPPRASFGFYKRAKQTRPPSAPGPVASTCAATSLAVLDDKHARHKSLTPEMERRIANSSIQGGGPLILASGSREIVTPSADVRETRESPESTLVASSSASSSNSDADSVVLDDEDDDGSGKEGNRTDDKHGRISVPMELDAPPALNYTNLDPSVITGPGTGPSISNSGGFSLLEHIPWASSFSSSSPSPSPSPVRMAVVNDVRGLAATAARKKGRDKKTLYEESASFPRVPLNSSAQLFSTHEGDKTSTDTLVHPLHPSTPTYERFYPSSPLHHTAITTAPGVDMSSDEKARGVAIPQLNTAGTYATTLTLKIPTPRSTYHWAVGETLRTGLVRVRFVIGCKITLATPTGGTETWKAPETEFLVGPIDAWERAKILAGYEAATTQRQPPQDVPAHQPIQASPIDDTHSRLISKTLGAPPSQQLRLNDGRSPVPNPPLLAIRTIQDHEQEDGLPRPRDSTESTTSTTSFVAISVTSPSAPNGGRSVASNLSATQSSVGVGGCSGKFSFLRNARKTPPPPARPTSPPRGGPPASAFMMTGYPYKNNAPKRRPSANTSSSGGSSNKMPKLSRPRTASGIVNVPSKSAAPTAISGDQPIDITRIAASVNPAEASGIGIRRRRLSASPPPPARPSPSPIIINSNGGGRYHSNTPPPSSLPRSPTTRRPPPPIPASFSANSNSARLAGTKSPNWMLNTT